MSIWKKAKAWYGSEMFVVKGQKTKPVHPLWHLITSIDRMESDTKIQDNQYPIYLLTARGIRIR